VALVLYLLLPRALTLGPNWLIPVLEGALVVFLTIRAPRRHPAEGRLIRVASESLLALVLLATFGSLGLLVRLVLSGGAVTGQQLIISGIQIWGTLMLGFALLYWELDRGGPQQRGHPEEGAPDFLFTQMSNPELTPAGWMPGFVDYLFLAFTNATAFSPTDTMPLTTRAKLLMLLESSGSIVTIVMVAGRAVNILK
jgi:hypothetical protein